MTPDQTPEDATRRFIDEGKAEPAAPGAAGEAPSQAKTEAPATRRKESPTDIERADEHGHAGDRSAGERSDGASGRSADAAQRSVQRESMPDSGTGSGSAQERQR